MKHIRILSFVLILFFAQWSCAPAKRAATETVSISVADEKIFTDVQRQTFQYFWDGAEPTSGLARERFHADDVYPQNDKNTVTSGGGGFGVMAILVPAFRSCTKPSTSMIFSFGSTRMVCMSS